MNEVQKEVARLRSEADRLYREVERAFGRQGSRSILSDSIGGVAYRAYHRAWCAWSSYRVRHEETFPTLAEFCSEGQSKSYRIEMWCKICRPRTAAVRTQMRKLLPVLKGRRSWVQRFSRTKGTQIIRFEMLSPHDPEYAATLLSIIDGCPVRGVPYVADYRVATTASLMYLTVVVQAADPCLICAHLSGGHYVYDGSCGHSIEEIACYTDRLKESGELPM